MDGSADSLVPAYLVLLDDVLVAMDIAETIREIAPGASVHVFADEAEAIAALEGLRVLTQAFVAADPAGFDGSDLAKGITLRGGAVVLLGDAAEEAGATPWPVLQRPFGRDALIAQLRKPLRPSVA